MVERRRFFLGEKIFFIPPRSAHYGCDRVLLLTTLYGGARRRLVGGFYEVSDMELLIGVGGNRVGGNYG